MGSLEFQFLFFYTNILQTHKMKEFFWKQLFLFVSGVNDSFKFKNFKRYCFSTNSVAKKIRQTLFMSFVHLGLFFILSDLMVKKISSHRLATALFTLLQNVPFIETILKVLYYGLWIGPQYIGLCIYTQFWFGDIADNAAIIEREQYKNDKFQIIENLEVDSLLALKMKKIIFTIVYLIFSLSFSMFICNIPYIGFMILVLLYAIYYACLLYTSPSPRDQA
eukprot:TRINITY_DN22944_c0_g1_i1.p1 TRINITY_DN22944_c0_g1~~TRINITY_DN22944_c0_g1_i1.p1  ORF type:complete len:221 (+),score=18.38 TRINITY_DN22944_c0_g1_i1:224-886(+)